MGGYPTPNLEWLRDYTPVDSPHGSAFRLTIPNLSASDNGLLLTCRAGMNITTTIRIRVEGEGLGTLKNI